MGLITKVEDERLNVRDSRGRVLLLEDSLRAALEERDGKSMNCVEAPRGSGYCDMCASGRTDLCRYVNTTGAIKEIEALRADLAKAEGAIGHYVKEEG